MRSLESTASLEGLRLLTQTGQSSVKEYWPSPGLSAGVPKGIVAELLGPARTSWLLSFFSLYPEHFIFWCEREPQILPTAIQQRGVELSRIKFINSAGDLQQPLRLAFESQFYPFIVAPNRFQEIRIFHRLHLLAEKSKCTLFLMAEKKLSTAWPISLQLEINFKNSLETSDLSDEIEIQIHRQRYGRNE